VKPLGCLISACALITALTMGALAPASAAAAKAAKAETLSPEDAQCLACHGEEGVTRRFGDDDERSLRVDGAVFAGSAHAPIGCVGCHGDIDVQKHPGDDRSASAKFASWREFSRAQARSCRGCHEPVADAWATSAHGRAAVEVGPYCSSCHAAHGVSLATSNTRMRDVCLSCHEDALGAHESWLPNTKIHFEAVSCAACHSPGAGRNIELRLFDPVARTVVNTPSPPGALAQAESDTSPIDANRLARLVKGLEGREGAQRPILRGWIQVRSPEESHRLHEKGKALRDCAACHSTKADPFREVTLSLIGPDGRRVRFEAQPDVLHNARSLDVLSNFYAIGGTRIGLLDTLLALALLAGIGAPVLHLVLRRVLRPAANTSHAVARTADSSAPPPAAGKEQS